MRRVDRREVAVVDVATTQPSPYARSLLFGYVAQFVYEGDSPIAERRAAALSLDQGLLAELLGRAELRELLDPEVLAEVEAELQRLAPDRRARDAEGVADLLRLLGPLTTDEVRARAVDGADVADWLADPGRRPPGRRGPGRRRGALDRHRGRRPAARRARRPGPARHPRRLRRARRRPAGRPGRPLRPHPRPVHQPTRSPRRLGLGDAVVRHTLQRLAAQGRVLDGEFRPSGSGTEWCDAEVLRRLRRRSLARLRQEVEPVEPEALAPVPRRLAARRRTGCAGVDGVLTVVDQLAGCAVPGRRARVAGARRPGARLRAGATSTS